MGSVTRRVSTSICSATGAELETTVLAVQPFRQLRAVQVVQRRMAPDLVLWPRDRGLAIGPVTMYPSSEGARGAEEKTVKALEKY